MDEDENILCRFGDLVYSVWLAGVASWQVVGWYRATITTWNSTGDIISQTKKPPKTFDRINAWVQYNAQRREYFLAHTRARFVAEFCAEERENCVRVKWCACECRVLYCTRDTRHRCRIELSDQNTHRRQICISNSHLHTHTNAVEWSERSHYNS